MSKQLITSEPPAAATSIGNYKGVMLCNRPGDQGSAVRQRGKDAPFISRVTPDEQLGLTPTLKVGLRRAKGRNLEILNRHRKWLQQLKHRKDQLTDEERKKAEDEDQRRRRIAEQAAKKRAQILGQENTASEQKPPAEEVEKPPSEVPVEAKPKKLTTENLRAHTREMAKERPKWAMTEEEVAAEEEGEVDELLDFANSLDYDEIVNDIEVRQALEILRDRVEELKQDQDWKEKIVKKYNQDAKSQDAKSQASAASLKSMQSKVAEKLNEEAANKTAEQLSEAGWDKATRSDKLTATLEEKAAKLMADQVLENNPQFKKVHSNMSIRRLLEKEAKRQLELGPKPIISVIKETATLYGKEDPSNLPYLHRNPAV